MIDHHSLPEITVEQPVHRIIPSQFPVRGIWDAVTRAEDLEDTLEVEALTNERVRRELEILRRMPPEHRMIGPGTTPVMAALCNPPQSPNRFADHRFGGYYAGCSKQTAVLETVFHRERFLASSAFRRAGVYVMRRYECRLQVPLPSLSREEHADLLDPDLDSYPRSAAFAYQLYLDGRPGLHYPSVRDAAGHCVVIYDPRAIVYPVLAVEHLQYHWDGHAITHVSTISDAIAMPAAR